MTKGKLYNFLLPSGVDQTVPNKDVKPKEIWTGFKEKTTAHGVPHVDNARGSIKTGFWTVTSLLCLGLLIFNITKVTRYYFDYRVNVVFSLIKGRELTFPAVTVCNMNPVKTSAIVQHPQLVAALNLKKKRRRRRRKRSASCPSPIFTADNGQEHCFYMSTTSYYFEDKSSAELACGLFGVGGVLSTIDTPAKRDHIQDNHIAAPGYDRYWIDLKKAADDNWYWVTSGDLLTWSNWKTGYPTGLGKCVVGEYSDPDEAWINVRCASYTAGGMSICEIVANGANAVTADATTSTTTMATTTESDTTTVAMTTEVTSQGKTTTQVTTPLETTTVTTPLETTTAEETTTRPLETTEATTPLETTTHPLETTEVTTSPEPTTLGETTAQELETTEVTTPLETTTLGETMTQQLETTEVKTTADETTTQPLETTEVTTPFETTTADETTTQPLETTELATPFETTTSEATAAQPLETKTKPLETTEVTTPTTTLLETTSRPVHTTTAPKIATSKQTTETAESQTIASTTPVVSTSSSATSNRLTTWLTTLAQQETTHEDTTVGIPITTTTKTSTSTVKLYTPGGEFEISEGFQQEEMVIEVLSDLPDEEKKNLGYTADDFILDCQYAGVTCYANQFSYLYDSLHGNCYVFNWNQTEGFKRSYKTGRRHGLKLILHVQQDEYIEGVNEGAGARVVVHTQDRMPFPQDEGVLATPGKLNSIGLRQIFLRRRPEPYSDCADPDDTNIYKNLFEEYYPIKYSTSACSKTCYQRTLIETCGCADPQYPRQGVALGNHNASSCKQGDAYENTCRNDFALRFNSDEIVCDCPSPCSETTFDFSMSSVEWPSDVYEAKLLEKLGSKISPLWEDPNDSDKYRRNLLKLEVYFEELNYEAIDEKPAYRAGSFLSDVGGILGLWLGCSVLSLFEVLELLMDFIILGLCRLVGGANTTPREPATRGNQPSDKGDNGGTGGQRDGRRKPEPPQLSPSLPPSYSSLDRRRYGETSFTYHGEYNPSSGDGPFN